MSSISIERVRKSLEKHFLFALFSPAELDDLAGHARLQHLAAGEALFASGRSGAQAFMLLSGRLKITANGPRGNELLLALNEPGDFTGFVAPFDEGKRFVNGVALRRSEVIAIDRKDLMPPLERNPAALVTLVEMMTRNLRAAVEICQSIGLLDSQARLWSRLMNLSERYGESVGRNGHLRIDHGLSQEDLASSIGVTRVMVSRALREWRELGLVETGRGYLEIIDPERLKRKVLGRSSES